MTERTIYQGRAVWEPLCEAASRNYEDIDLNRAIIMATMNPGTAVALDGKEGGHGSVTVIYDDGGFAVIHS